LTRKEIIEKYKDLILTYGEVFIPEFGTLTKDEIEAMNKAKSKKVGEIDD